MLAKQYTTTHDGGELSLEEGGWKTKINNKFNWQRSWLNRPCSKVVRSRCLGWQKEGMETPPDPWQLEEHTLLHDASKAFGWCFFCLHIMLEKSFIFADWVFDWISWWLKSTFLGSGFFWLLPTFSCYQSNGLRQTCLGSKLTQNVPMFSQRLDFLFKCLSTRKVDRQSLPTDMWIVSRTFR